MVEIDVAYPGEPIYPAICRFAQDIYLTEHGAYIDPSPDLFAYALFENCLVGCLGLSCAKGRTLLLFETYVPSAYVRLSGSSHPDRKELAEIGTRVVELPSAATVRSIDVSVALTAALLCDAYRLGIRYVGFTTTKLVRHITEPLGFTLVNLGEPDLSGKDSAFRLNWQNFFRVPQMCAGFCISSLEGCETEIRRLRDRGVLVRNRHL